MKNNIKIQIFYCTNSFDADVILHQFNAYDNIDLKLSNLPCTGKIELPYLLKAFELKADALMIFMCTQGSCQHIEGNLRAKKRMQALDILLEEIGLQNKRTKIIHFNELKNTKQLHNELKGFINKLLELK